MLSMRYDISSDDNDEESNDDDSPSPLRRLLRQRKRLYRKQNFVDSLFIFRLLNYVIFKLNYYSCVFSNMFFFNIFCFNFSIKVF